MENAESLVNKTAEIHEFASEVARMITGAQMPEFSSENMSVADASKLIGLRNLTEADHQEVESFRHAIWQWFILMYMLQIEK